MSATKYFPKAEHITPLKNFLVNMVFSQKPVPVPHGCVNEISENAIKQNWNTTYVDFIHSEVSAYMDKKYLGEVHIHFTREKYNEMIELFSLKTNEDFQTFNKTFELVFIDLIKEGRVKIPDGVKFYSVVWVMGQGGPIEVYCTLKK